MCDLCRLLMASVARRRYERLSHCGGAKTVVVYQRVSYCGRRPHHRWYLVPWLCRGHHVARDGAYRDPGARIGAYNRGSRICRCPLGCDLVDVDRDAQHEYRICHIPHEYTQSDALACLNLQCCEMTVVQWLNSDAGWHCHYCPSCDPSP